MGVTRPTAQGGTISVSDSASLTTMDTDGLPLGSTVWNIDVGAAFKLTASARTVIAIDATTDGYDDPQWVFAAADFTGFEGCTLQVVLNAPNESFSANYVIDTVDDTDTVTVIDPPDGATNNPYLAGSAVLFDDALVTDSVVAARGLVGVRWVLVATGNAATATAPQNATTFLNDLTAVQDSITTLDAAAANIDISVAGDTDGDYEFDGVLLLTGNASANIVTLQPNSLATNQSGRTVFANNGNQAEGSNVSSFLIAGPTNTADSTCVVRGRLSSKSGRIRVFTGTGTGTQTNGDSFGYDSVVYWTDTATAITSLRFHSTITLGFRTGSFIRLRKLHNLS